MQRTFDIVAALLLFVSGLYIAWVLWVVDQMLPGSPRWWYWSLAVAACVSALAAIGLFLWRRPAAIIGSLTSVALAAAFCPRERPNFQMLSEFGISTILLFVGILVYLRFILPASQAAAVAQPSAPADG